MLAHASKVRRITIRALCRAMALSGYCEHCGGSSDGRVAFHANGSFTEVCAACLGQANRRVDDDKGNALR